MNTTEPIDDEQTQYMQLEYDEPTTEPCDCKCHSPAFYAPHKEGHACCEEANVIEDNSLLVKTTNTTEPIDEQIEAMKAEFYASDLSPKSFDLTIGIRTKMLISDQVAKAREDGRLIELDLLEQALNEGRNIHKHKLQRLADLITKSATLNGSKE